ncbi:putative L-fucose isomerase [Blattamonas nauphoetae]|uniref:L-fucose isomerase n=1 Tax=Blattamonas nauphoetae TaxID=2049346 RepID=A0ABQ9XLW7_9EUKA|nr:putative L-fucose isomerase [Blattamonas nauphoetae]
MEILSFIREKGLIAEILHGRPEYIGSRITTLVSFRRAIRSIRGSKFGVIGKPSNWLIASSGDYSSPLKRYLDAELVDITMEEFLLEVKKEDFPPNADAPFVGKYDENTLKKAMHIYGALRRLVDKYHLSALTVRCFDLLGMLCNTSCLGLALLNKEGITASCEGDVPAMVSMVILRALTGQSSFQSNPSTIDVPTNTLTLAHCTVPLDMVDAFELHSHFESGLGVAVRGTIQPGNVTIFKCSGDLSRYFVSNAHLEQNLTSEHLCRTQIIVKPEKSVDYFLRDSIGNHHIVVRGHHAEVVDEFFRALKGSS